MNRRNFMRMLPFGAATVALPVAGVAMAGTSGLSDIEAVRARCDGLRRDDAHAKAVLDGVIHNTAGRGFKPERGVIHLPGGLAGKSLLSGPCTITIMDATGRVLFKKWEAYIDKN